MLFAKIIRKSKTFGREKRIVIALGGNALQSGKAEPTAEAQLAVVKQTCERIAEISQRGYEIAVVHGNGPQVGRILLASETAKEVTPAMPFDVCGAMSQGYIAAIFKIRAEYPQPQSSGCDAGNADGCREGRPGIPESN